MSNDASYSYASSLRPLCRRSNARRSRRATAFTLVEMLVTLALTALLAALTSQIAVNTAATQKTARRIVFGIQREAYVFDRIGGDLARLIPTLGEDESALQVFGTPRQVLQLTALAPVESESLHTVQRPATVRYRLVRTEPEAAFHLIRETIDRTTPGARPVRETISTGLVNFTLEVLKKGRWTRHYPATVDGIDTPLAIRVGCRWVDSTEGESRIRTFLVPGGS